MAQNNRLSQYLLARTPKRNCPNEMANSHKPHSLHLIYLVIHFLIGAYNYFLFLLPIHLKCLHADFYP